MDTLTKFDLISVITKAEDGRLVERYQPRVWIKLPNKPYEPAVIKGIEPQETPQLAYLKIKEWLNVT